MGYIKLSLYVLYYVSVIVLHALDLYCWIWVLFDKFHVLKQGYPRTIAQFLGNCVRREKISSQFASYFDLD